MPFSPCVIERGRDVVRLRLHGELDLASTPDIAAAATELLDGEVPGRVVLDLRGVTFMDCRGLRAILALAERARRAAVPVTVVAAPPKVQRVFDLTATAAALEWETTAVRMVRSRAA